MTIHQGGSPSRVHLVETIHRIPRVSAGEEFRTRLREEFVSGTFRHGRGSGSAARPFVTTMLATAAAACVIALATAFLNTGPAWRVASVTGTGELRVDGRPVTLIALGSHAARLRPGATLEVPDSAQVDLELPGLALLQVVGGSKATVPGSPGRWFARTMAFSLERGEARGSTGPGFAGTRFIITTPEAQARIAGTTFAVIRNRDASCVCVLEGGVAMITGASTDTVRAGFRRSVFRDGRPPLLEAILPMETMKLTMLRAQAEQRLRR